MSTTFPNQNKTATGKDGAELTLANAKKEVSYSASPYSYDFIFTSPEDWLLKKSLWEIDEDTTFPYLTNWSNFPTPDFTLFPNDNSTATGKDGADITDANAKLKNNYRFSPYNYVFGGFKWRIDETVAYPFIDTTGIIISDRSKGFLLGFLMGRHSS